MHHSAGAQKQKSGQKDSNLLGAEEQMYNEF